MVFPGLLETSKMYMFASVVHFLCTNNVNVHVSKIFPSRLMLRGFIYGGAYIWDVNWACLTAFYGMVSDLKISHGKMADFVSFPLFGLTLVIKLRNFNFEGH